MFIKILLILAITSGILAYSEETIFVVSLGIIVYTTIFITSTIHIYNSISMYWNIGLIVIFILIYYIRMKIEIKKIKHIKEKDSQVK